MTAAAELIDGFFQHKDLIRCMRIVAGHAPWAGENIVDKRYFLFPDGSDELRHVAVTGQTQIQRTLRPELMTVVFAVRIMAQSAAAQVDGSVRHGLFKPACFSRVARQTDIPNGC